MSNQLRLAALLLMTSLSTGADETRVLTDFSDDGGLDWTVVNDNVMGGRSDGDFSINGDQLDFSGVTNTRGGGFSSVRARHDGLDLADYSGIRLRVKGDGRRYSWLIQTSARYRGQRVSFWAEFDTKADEWITVDLPFASFVPKFRGYELNVGPPDPTEIRGMGLMIYDGNDGPFRLVLDQIAAYGK